MKSPRSFLVPVTSLLLSALVPGLVSVATLVHAQTAPATRVPKAVQDEVVSLSPFTIISERDTGWSANDTLSATRTKQALKDVPVNIDALTSDFLEDLGLRSADDAAEFVANVFALPIMENDNHKGNFSFRGLSQANNVSRNYFRWYIPSDTYNVERIDFGKGSNSLIFGEVEPGGQGAVFTKRPLFKNFGEVQANVTNEGAYRFQVDLNRRLSDTIAFRFNGVRRMQRTFQDASDYRFEGETFALAWQPRKETSLRLEYEQGEYQNTRGLAGILVREQSARGRGFTGTASGAIYTSDGTWIIQAAQPAIDRANANSTAGGLLSLIEGSYVDVQMRNAAGVIVGTKRINGLPKHYNLRGAFDLHGRPYRSISATVEHKLGPVSAELAYNYQTQQEERNDNNFSEINVDVAGRPYMDANLDRKWFRNDVHAFRGSAVFNFDKIKGMEQVIVAGAEYREDQTLNLRWQYFNTKNVENGTATALNQATDRGRLRVYLDDPAFYSRGLFERMRPENLPATNLVQMVPLRFFAAGTSAADGTSWQQSYAGSLSASGRYFGGRLQSLLGVRRDWGRVWDYQALRKEGFWKEDIAPPNRKDALPGEYLQNIPQRLARNSFTAGLTFALNRDINLYTVYSESFRFQDFRTFDRVQMGPVEGSTKEIGLKGSLWGGKIGFTFGAFDIDRDNVRLSWNNIVGFTGDQTEDLMNPNNILPGAPGYKFREPGSASASRNYVATEKSRGADLTLLANPTRNLQLRFTFAYTDVFSQPDLKSFRDYYAAAAKRGDESPTLLSDAKLLLDTLDIQGGATGARASPWSISWVADYTFTRESRRLLSGVRAGVNGSWRDDYLLGVPNGQKMVGGATHLVNAYLMRDQKIWGRQVRIRAGVKGLVELENGEVRKFGFSTLANGTNVYNYAYVMPPQFDLTVTVRF